MYPDLIGYVLEEKKEWKGTKVLVHYHNDGIYLVGECIPCQLVIILHRKTQASKP